VNLQDSEGNSAFTWAVKYEASLELVKMMVEKDNGADIFLANKNCETVLFFARGRVLEYLCDVLQRMLYPLLFLFRRKQEKRKK